MHRLAVFLQKNYLDNLVENYKKKLPLAPASKSFYPRGRETDRIRGGFAARLSTPQTN